MYADFWLQRWKNNEIGFHESKANPLLVHYFKDLSLANGSRVFLPLCGKTLDIAWLLGSGFCVVGAELVEMAIEQLFTELKLEPTISSFAECKCYSANNIDIWVGDIFAVTAKMLGSVDAIYDRAALVALPEEMRQRYTSHLREITANARQLLITYEYDQNFMAGPPFSVSNKEVNQHYSHSYELFLLSSESVPGGLKGKCPAIENVWFLKAFKTSLRG